MILTKKQEEGLKIAINRYKSHEPYTCIAGFAGTGKSTLVKFIVSALELDEEEVAYISFTGKASLVLKNKGCHNAMTAHKLLYKSVKNSDGSFKHIPRMTLAGDYKLIVVDEVSMLPLQMWELLLSHRIHVIAMGDPGQLPPIGESHDVLYSPHIFLDEIMRQAAESEIIRLSMDIRENKIIKPFKGKEINIVRQKDVVDGMYSWADQIICGKNMTRHSINDYMRAMKWGDDYNPKVPREGDKLICLNNNWDMVTQEGSVLINGLIGTCGEVNTAPGPFGTQCWIDFIPDDNPNDIFRQIPIDYKLISTGEPTITKENFRKFPKNYRLEQFDYGYAITCHKSQGSEYPKVLIFEEMLKSTEHNRWLYTAVTRASDKITLVLKD